MGVEMQEVRTRSDGAEPERPLKFVFFPLSWVLAHVGRTVEIAKVLRARGHEVIFAGADPGHPRSHLRQALQAGFPVVPVKEPHLPEAWDRFHRHGLPAAAYDVLTLWRWAPLDEILDDILRVTQEQQPDMIVGDSSVGVSTAAHLMGIPAAGILNAYNTHFFRRWSLTWAGIHLLERLYLSRWRRRIYRKRAVQQVNAFDLLRSMPLLSPDLPEFHAPQSDVGTWHPIGPIVFEPDAPLPAWYAELGDGTPNVYITMGSTGLLEPLLRRFYPAAARLPYRFVVTTGGQVSEATMAQAPANFRFTQLAPGSKLLEHCRAMIFHGGNGSMYQALGQGVPMIALPSHLEQQLCAAMMEREGLGLTRSARRCTGGQLAKALETVLGDPGYAARARAFQGKVSVARAAEVAADLLTLRAREGVPPGHGLGGARSGSKAILGRDSSPAQVWQ